MFGSDNSQPQYGVQTNTPVNDDDIMKNGSLEQSDTVASTPVSNDATVAHTDASNVFAPSAAVDPFGTTQPAQVATDDASATADNIIPSATTTESDASLLDIKQQALQHLSPLVEHLDQSPEEKFKTTMMMIQASDDKTLVPAAFGAAKQIVDDKARAQALLDIINEINYFTQQ